MNNEQIWLAARTVLTCSLAFAAGRGWLSSNDVAQLTPLLGSAGLLVYALYLRRNDGLALSAKQIPGIILATTADASPALKDAAASKAPENANIVSLQELKS